MQGAWVLLQGLMIDFHPPDLVDSRGQAYGLK